ncbi:zinc-dependent alcohol dehydrogenase [Planctomycetaceae bacterium SH139]
MKALLLKEYKQIELTDVPEPEVGPEDVLVRVHACGICGSDIHGYDGSTGRRIPPLVMGHEAAGVIESVGASVTEFQPGDRVTFDSTISCGKCHFCRRGEINLCDNRRVLGVSCGDYRQNGAFAELVAVPQNIIYRLPDELSFEAAALIEAVSIAVHAVNITKFSLGDSVVVVGSGMIGLLTIQAAKLKGAGLVIATDVAADRLDVARQLGADVTLNASQLDIPAEVRQLTAGRGADAVLEVVGHQQTVNDAIAAVRKGGAVTLVGNLSPTIEFPLQSVVTREITVQGSCASQGEYPQCIRLLSSGAIKVAPLITAKSTLAEGAEWFAKLYEGVPGAMKVLVCPQS